MQIYSTFVDPVGLVTYSGKACRWDSRGMHIYLYYGYYKVHAPLHIHTYN